MRLRRITSLGVCLCVMLWSPAAVAQNGLPAALSDADTRLTTGIESVSASAAVGKQHFLVDFMLTAPLSGPAPTRKAKPWWEAWLNARFSGSPTTAVSGVKQFVGGFEDELISGDTSSILNALSFRAGIELKLSNGTTFQRDYQFQPALIAAIGVTTVPALDKPAIFELTPGATTRLNVPQVFDAAGKPTYTHVGFTDPDRRRFYRKFEAGLRLKTHHFDDCSESEPACDANARVNFPGVIDLTLGQDASLTGGARRGLVGNIDAFYPLPTDTLANAIYLFGTVRVQWVKDVPDEEPPLLLKAASGVVQVPSPELWIHTLSANQRTRDEWKFGIGVDLVRLFSGAAEERARDEANALRESVSALDHHNDDEVRVATVEIMAGQQVSMTHGIDFFLPRVNGRFEVRPPSGDALITKTFAANDVEPAFSTRARYKNVGATRFESLLLRIKPGEGKSDSLKTFTLTMATETTPPIGEDAARYRISRFTCSAHCTVTSAPDADNLLVIIPLATDPMVKVAAGGATPAWTSYQPIIVARKTALQITGGPNGAEFIVLRLR